MESLSNKGTYPSRMAILGLPGKGDASLYHFVPRSMAVILCRVKDGGKPMIFRLTRYKCDGLPRSIMAGPWQSTLPRL